MGRRFLKVTGVILILAIAALYIVFFKPALLLGNVESSIESRLQGLIGPAASYSVRIDTPLLRMIHGDMGDIDITGNQVRLNNGIVAEQLNISLRDVKVNIPANKITKVGSDSFTVTINQGDLDRYIAATFPEIPDLSVKMHNGKMAVETKEEVALINSRIRFDGTIDIEDGHKLMLKLHDVEAGRTHIPGSIKNKIEDKLNPILDTDNWNIGTELKSLTIQEGKVEVKGKVDPKDLTSLQKSASS